MKNLPVAKKLTIMLVAIIALFLTCIIIGISGMLQVQSELETFYRSPYQVRAASRELARAIEGAERELYRYVATNSATEQREAAAKLEEWSLYEAENLVVVQERFLGSKDLVVELQNGLDSLKQQRDKIMAMHVKGTEHDTIIANMEKDNYTLTESVSSVLAEIIAFANNKGDTLMTSTRATQTSTILSVAILAIISLVISLTAGIWLVRMLTLPINRIRQYMMQVGQTGDLRVPEKLSLSLAQDAKNKDEVGQTIFAFNQLIEHISAMADALEILSQKNLTGHVTALSKNDILGRSINELQQTLMRIFTDIKSAVASIAAATSQVADGASALAQGTSEQSVALEQLSTSISGVTDKAIRNADRAQLALEHGEMIRQKANRGTDLMVRMVESAAAVNETGQSLARILDAINDIAFQTKILSLNAAIQAASAGEYGKAFTVVANEVKILAQNSATAAKNSHELLEETLDKSRRGLEVSQKTATALTDIIESVERIDQMLSEIASSSKDQRVAMEQVNLGVEQVAKVVQANAETAEQSASASEEMRHQAESLRASMVQFVLPE